MYETMKIMQKDVILEKCAFALATLSRREQTQAVRRAEGALARMRCDILNRNENDIDYERTLDQIYAYASVM